MMSAQVSSNRAFFNQLKKYYTFYTGGFVVFLIVLAILEQMGHAGLNTTMIYTDVLNHRLLGVRGATNIPWG
jgi:hypothetical protein